MSGSKETGLKAKQTILKKYGKDYYKQLSSKGGLARNGVEHAKKLKEKYGDDYFAAIRKGGKREQSNN